jgi:DNA-binding CsgD family transcriptional regulator
VTHLVAVLLPQRCQNRDQNGPVVLWFRQARCRNSLGARPVGPHENPAVTCTYRVALTAQLWNLELPAVPAPSQREIALPAPSPRVVQRQVRLQDQQILELLAQYAAGRSPSELAGLFGINEGTVYAHLKRQGAPDRPYRKLHGELLERAVELYVEQRLSLREVGRQLGIGRETVRAGLVATGIMPRDRRGR